MADSFDALAGERRPFDQRLSSLAPDPDWGNRYMAGTGKKGNGFLGPLLRPDGSISSELGHEFEYGGKTVSAPLIVPTLTKAQLDHLLGGGKPTPDIYDAAQQFAVERLLSGKPTWALPNEVYPLPK